MVSRCVNPSCKSEFWLLNTGDLYALERREADTEFFWLCSDCGKDHTLTVDARGQVTVCPRAEVGHFRPPSREYDLRLLARPVLSRVHLPEARPGDRPHTPAYMRTGVPVMSEAA